MTTSENGRTLVEQFEGLRLKAYRDPGGVWTIGWGHTFDVRAGDTITPSQADQFLTEDLMVAESVITKYVKVPLNQNQFDALVSFIYNEGGGNFATSNLLSLLNRGEYARAAQQFVYTDSEGNWHGWVFVNGEVNPGLVRRRLAEQKLFNTEAA